MAPESWSFRDSHRIRRRFRARPVVVALRLLLKQGASPLHRGRHENDDQNHTRGDKVTDLKNTILRRLVSVLLALSAGAVMAHGDVTPQAVDTSALKPLGGEWLKSNPYRGDKTAIRIGDSAFNQNCARCHGLEAISGGIAPDLRRLDNECASLKDEKKKQMCVNEMDEFFLTTIRHGRTRNGAVYMPPFEGIFNQEAMWAIKAYLESRREKPL